MKAEVLAKLAEIYGTELSGPIRVAEIAPAEISGRRRAGVVILETGTGDRRELYLDTDPCNSDKHVATFQWEYSNESADSVTCGSRRYQQRTITQK
jgi:hypothetical protein